MRLPLDLPLSLLLGAYPALYVAALTHEFGHALAARSSGFRVTSLGLGTGRPFLRTALPGGTIFYLCREEPLTGFCWTVPGKRGASLERRATLSLLLGGSIANLLLGTALLAVWRGEHVSLLLVLGALQIALGLSNLVPFSLPVGAGGTVLSSDGARALTLLALRHHRAQAPGALLALRPLWEAIGDTRQLLARLRSAADAAAALEDAELAARYQNEYDAIAARTGESSPAVAARQSEAGEALLQYIGEGPLDTAYLETLLARYEASRRRERYDTEDLRVYFAVVRARRELNDESGVKMAWGQARTAAHAVDAALAPDAEARTRFRERMRAAGMPPP